MAPPQELHYHPVDGKAPLFVINGEPMIDPTPYEFHRVVPNEDVDEQIFAIGVLRHTNLANHGSRVKKIDPADPDSRVVVTGYDHQVAEDSWLESAVFVPSSEGPAPVEMVCVPEDNSQPIDPRLEFALIRGGLLEVGKVMPEAELGVWTEMPNSDLADRLGNVGWQVVSFADRDVLVSQAA